MTLISPSRRLRTRNASKTHGFTLIELMIVVLIVGILAAFAIPSYNDYLRRGEITEAFNNLTSSRMKLEQYYQDNRNYGAGTCAGGGAIVNPNDVKYFDYTCVTTNADQGYLITATGKTGTGTVGYAYSVDEGNSKITISYKGAGVNKPCWLARGSEC
ncbi:MAG: type IV pilin protein [Leptothrix ochracea]|uniref:type IV pilin protein n=1 Tax=Leptothrix ochracea TaxID=735331 RepID=UPI0034E1CD9F